MPRYSIRKNRINDSFLEGFDYEGGTTLVLDEEKMFHCIFLPPIDSTETDGPWGRLSMKMESSGDSVLSFYILAVNHKESLSDAAGMDIDEYLYGDGVDVTAKLSFLRRMGAKRVTGSTDCLLYDVSGRFLYVAIEASGEGSVSISDIVIDSTGDNFMNTFPEVYRERNSFFHRYISIFSSIYNDFQRDINDLPKVLDLDVCPEEYLIVYGSWMGLDLKGRFLELPVLRRLVKEAYSLNRMKGTRKAIERILEIILDEKAVVIEHSLVRALHKEEDVDMLPNFKTRGIYDVTILVKQHLTEELRHQLTYILNQYKPVRTRIAIAQLDESPTADSNSYLDVNTVLPEEKEAVLDDELSMDGVVILK